ncbi:CAP domain-containing protein [Deinococcus sp. KNUC1210]|uniref:CAP domain-containing protein n=1 Tax=Deinococcus sp. KNUC1210 TaxID=2917691 RepID=UPI001EEFC358|nr:CAP domain-containing protein [Deinococcus sp. KNUC1210]ULH15603.1 CAP domain-containing protein [Deinococcus sp. KNUC1210]
MRRQHSSGGGHTHSNHVAGGGTGSTVSTQTLSPEETQILAAVDVARSQARVCGTQSFAATTPLTWNTLLAKAAKDHSQDLADVDFTADPNHPDLMHIGSNGSTAQQRIEAAGYIGWTSIGENFAAGYDVSQVVDAWIASPGHCKNLMSPKFHEIGVGYVYSASAKYHTYYTQDFGTR